MKNSTLSTILNIVLLIAVVVLFVLHFSSRTPGGSAVATTGTKAVPAGNFKIAYFEVDSIQNHFDYYKQIVSELDTKNQANQKVLGEMKNAFVAKYQELQKIGASLTPAEQQARQQELSNIENALRGKEKMMSDEMQDIQFRKMQDVKKKIEDYLKEYNKDKGYAYVFSSSVDLMYLKDSSYDITQDVVKGLNALYPKKK
ncbi:OmpH family outer membrane protein [Sediminibacterium roseum]|uniref:OmpH family outer membrane protein n=1 Tax=Sediminibacterium roseum TaxID=1978412 RepID=A0ABW9ZYS8_9BACT|nr:OmpH family outer membrane protein [Sediminibacterium roseum]NCI50877.1 OmpH family outer membrane protein [Sediminibacterium roseum]